MTAEMTIADASALIALCRIGRLGLLPAMFGEVHVPPAVFEEVTRYPDLAGASEVRDAEATWLHVEAPSTVAASDLALGDGERQCIQLALDAHANQKPCRLLLDERRGRTHAERLGLAPMGVLGILLRARLVGELPALRPEVDALLDAGFYVSERLRREVLVAAGEEP